MRLEDLVRTAAPYCLKAEWSPDVDREMVLLQVRMHLGVLQCLLALLWWLVGCRILHVFWHGIALEHR
jgi:hypothetical protein